MLTWIFRITLLVTLAVMVGAFGYTAAYTIEQDQRYERGIAVLELVILFIAACFYVYIVDHNLGSATPLQLRVRYLDWLLTTPLMLMVLILIYKQGPSIGAILKQQWYQVLGVAVLTIAMVIFGYIAHSKSLSWKFAMSALGFACLVGLFIWIYSRRDSDKDQGLFWYTVIVWSLYGLAYFAPFLWRNISYNILDMVAKPIFAIILVSQSNKVQSIDDVTQAS